MYQHIKSCSTFLLLLRLVMDLKGNCPLISAHERRIGNCLNFFFIVLCPFFNCFVHDLLVFWFRLQLATKDMSCRAPYSSLPPPLLPHNATGPIHEQGILFLIFWQLVIQWGLFSTCHLLLWRCSEIFAFSPVHDYLQISWATVVSIRACWVISATHLLHIASVA